MEFTEEVHSDGSYELVDLDDFSSDMDQCSDGSYDFISSDLSDILVLTNEEDSNNTPVNADNISAQIKSISLDSPRYEDSTKSVSTESDEKEEYVDMDFAESDEEAKEWPVLRIKIDQTIDPQKWHLKSLAYDKLRKRKNIKDVAKIYILPYLPAKSLARCRLVCKEWGKWISTPLFTYTQTQSFTKSSGFFHDEYGLIRFISLDHFSYGVPHPSLNFLPEKVSVKSSSNGLLLCQAFDDENGNYVCNPANKQFNKLPNSVYYHGKEPKIVLAFEPFSQDFESCFKVICPFDVPGGAPVLHFDIFDSNTKSWRTCEDICVGLNARDVKSEGVYVNGFVYWETTCGKLLTFDLKNEIHGVQTLPDDGGSFVKVGGKVCYVKGVYHDSIKMCILHVYKGGLMSSKATCVLVLILVTWNMVRWLSAKFWGIRVVILILLLWF